MPRLIPRTSARRVLDLTLLAAATVLLNSPSALGQLSDEDIKALREQGKKEGWTFTVGHNSATGYSLDDLCGVVVPEGWRDGAPFDACTPRGGLPEVYNWCDYGVCTPIKHQGSCGSCWAFALNGSVESNIAIVDSAIVDLSEQWLVSCCGLGGCSGEWPGNAANFYVCSGQYTDECGDYGAVLESDFPYVGWDAPCECPFPHPYCLDSWAFIGPQWGIPSVDALKQAIIDHGPVTVCVYANSAFQGYNGGVFNACEDEGINHAVVLVGWDDNQGTNGVWIMRNSWGFGWGEDGYMLIEYGCSRIGYGGLYVDCVGSGPRLAFDYPDGRPEFVAPVGGTMMRVVVTGLGGAIPQPGTGVLHYDVGDGWESVPMEVASENAYDAVFPPADCGQQVRCYVSAEATGGELFSDPWYAPANSHSAYAAYGWTVLWGDALDADPGWTTEGEWAFGQPAGGGGIYHGYPDPTSGATGNNVYGVDLYGDYSTVPSGLYHLTTGPIDLSDAAGPVTLRFQRWLNSDHPPYVSARVEVSPGGAEWISIWSNTAEITDNAWTQREVDLTAVLAGQSTGQVRWVHQIGDGAWAYSGWNIDDVQLISLLCAPRCPGDLDGDNDVDLGDLAQLLSNYGETSGMAYEDGDLDEDGDVDLSDLSALLAVYGTECP